MKRTRKKTLETKFAEHFNSLSLEYDMKQLKKIKFHQTKKMDTNVFNWFWKLEGSTKDEMYTL